MKNGLLFAAGFIVLVFGMALVMRQWDNITIVFHGVMPVLIAIGGLVMMFAATLKKS